MLQIPLDFLKTYPIISAIVLIVFLVFFQIILKPWVGIKYKCWLYGEKACGYFYPIAGLFQLNRRTHNVEDHLGHKMSVDHVVQNPKTKILFSNYKSQVCYYLHDPELIQEFIVKKRHLYWKYRENYLLIEDLIKLGISAEDGKQWKRLRKSSAPAFHFKSLATKIDHIKRYTNDFVNDIDKHIKSGSQEHYNTYYNVLTFSGCVLISSLMGEDFIKRHQKEGYDILHEQDYLVTQAIVKVAQESPMNYVRSFFFPGKKVKEIPEMFYTQFEKDLIDRIDQYCKKIDDYIIERIEATKQGKGDAEDFLQTHVNEFIEDEKNKDQNDPSRMTVEVIRHQFTNMFTAGVGAPTSALSICLANLAIHKEWQDILRQEMNEQFNFDDDNEAIFNTITSNMPKLEAFTKEVFRHYCPSSGFFHHRTALEDHYLGEFKVKKGDIVLVNILGNSHNPTYYENPLKFDPTRWYAETKHENVHTYQFLPFLGGIRNCIGQHLARLEIKFVLLNILKRYRLERTEVPFQTRFDLNLRMQDGRVIKYIPLDSPMVN